MKNFDYIGIGFCSNDHLAVLPFIPMDTKVRMLSHRIMGGGPPRTPRPVPRRSACPQRSSAPSATTRTAT